MAKKMKKVGIREIERAFRERAEEIYADDGDLEIDPRARVSISRNNDVHINGAYVQMWKYVELADLPEDLVNRLRAAGQVEPLEEE